MSNDQIKPITISPGLLNIGHRSVKNKTAKRVQNNNKPNLLKRDLLAKIKNYRTNKLRQNDVVDSSSTTSTIIPNTVQKNIPNTVQKNIPNTVQKNIPNTVINNPEQVSPPVSVVRKQNTRSQNNEGDDDFSQSINFLKTLSAKKKRHTEKNKDDFPVNLSESDSKFTNPPYSCLKNSSLPTFREWRNKSLKKSDDNNSEPNYEIISGEIKDTPPLDKPTRINRSVSFKYNLGKKGRSVSVLIKNAETRKKVSAEHTRLKETKLSDMKSYLKRHNLLKSGSRAQPDVINKLYEQCLLAGDIRNANKNNIIHNYLAE
jgi:hypothetical protein